MAACGLTARDRTLALYRTHASISRPFSMQFAAWLPVDFVSLLFVICVYVRVCVFVCVLTVFIFLFFFECVGVLPFDGEIKMPSLAAQCIIIGPVCNGCNGRAGGRADVVCLWVCYHDNSKLRASILIKLGVYMKVVTISSWLKFGRPAPPGRGSAAGRNFLAPPFSSQRV